MERLTYRDKDGMAMMKERGGWKSGGIERLASYEDTGLEPGEIYEVRFLIAAQRDPQKLARLRELVLADQNGQLVVLPCKVGDSIYIPDLEKKIPIKVRVQGISISVSGRTILHFGGYPVECAWGDGCGKDWFLTREEADAALSNANKIPCKHGLSRHRNEIGEDEVYCELNAKWMNVSLGDCLGNCESEAALAGKGGDG